jgi:hypothetical protein
MSPFSSIGPPMAEVWVIGMEDLRVFVHVRNVDVLYKSFPPGAGPHITLAMLQVKC